MISTRSRKPKPKYCRSLEIPSRDAVLETMGKICTVAEYEPASLLVREPALPSEHAQIYLAECLASAAKDVVCRMLPEEALPVCHILYQTALIRQAPLIEQNARRRAADAWRRPEDRSQTLS